MKLSQISVEAIQIRRQVEGCYALVTPSGNDAQSWSNVEPLERDHLIDRLVEIGCTLRRPPKALQFADEDWEDRHCS
jgi:hypothetical protein